MEGNEPREAGVGEGQALHVEVCAALAARELQQVRRALWPQDRAVPGGLPAPWERAGGQRCVPVSEEPEPLLRGRGLSLSRDITGWRPRTGAMGAAASPQCYRKPSVRDSPLSLVHSLPFTCSQLTPKDQGDSLCPWPQGAHGLLDKSLQSCLTLCGPMDPRPPGFSVHEIFQARILEWAAVPASRGSSRSRDRTHVSYVSCIGRRVLSH